jgi:3-(3-hydroxy-phenyl)propionate hydroxylase
MTAHFDADVAIIGYGPTGVSAANFLGSLGVSVIAFEREKDIYQRARAVTVNDWTLRCFQAAGLDQILLKDMDPHTVYRWRNFAGRELMRMTVPHSTLGQPSAMAIYQPVMEQTLRDGAARFADMVKVNFGERVTGLEQDASSVVVSTGEKSVRVKYALACDGGSSSTREQLGIKMLGDTIETRWVVIDARVKRWWPERHILTFWSDKTRPVVDIALAMGNHRWEFPLAAHESESDFSTHEQLWKLLGSMSVTPDDVEIHQHAFYRHHVRKAESWRDKRVFLLGDAAHLMPPWAGQGMQSGIRDAFNLSWKLHEVLRGRVGGVAAETLLDSYETERAPNVAMLTAFTEELGRIIKMQMTPRETATAITSQLLQKMGLKPAAPASAQPPTLEVGWINGSPAKGSALGKMPPQPVMCTPKGHHAKLDDLIGFGFALMGDECDPAALLSPADRAAWEKFDAKFIAVRSPKTGSAAASDLIDLDGSLLKWMRVHQARVVALRPDRFVCGDLRSGLVPPA